MIESLYQMLRSDLMITVATLLTVPLVLVACEPTASTAPAACDRHEFHLFGSHCVNGKWDNDNNTFVENMIANGILDECLKTGAGPTFYITKDGIKSPKIAPEDCEATANKFRPRPK